MIAQRRALMLPLSSPRSPWNLQSLYTGVYGKGGPTSVDMDPTSLASLCDRTPADARGVKVCKAAGRRHSPSHKGVARADSCVALCPGAPVADGPSARYCT